MGDFNYDNSKMSQNNIDYTNHIRSKGCAQLINKPTRIGKTSSTIIEHIYADVHLTTTFHPLFFMQIFQTIYLFALKLNTNRLKNHLSALSYDNFPKNVRKYF